MEMREVRVRFAPSPTGPLHIGGVRTALYNYLFARKLGGKFILRIEDTDQGRFVPGAEQYIIESLTWCGIHFDEGVHIGGPYAPYRQSDRKEMYHQYALQLINNGKAYYAFDTPEELEVLRKDFESRKETFQYGPITRSGLKNSLTLPKSEVQSKLDAGEHYVIRIKIPEHETITVNDLIRGVVQVDSSLLDDKVLYKSDGMPTYHLANVVDDYLMKISHVIRGEEWLPSAPLHVLLYRYLGWEAQMPEFAHLPLLLKPDGNGKLSKRDGDRLGFPVFPLKWTDPKSGEISSGYRESGYLPEAFINMLAFLGWNPGTEQELFSMEELCHAFTIDRVSKSGAKFDVEKAHWYNHQYMARKAPAELASLLNPLLKAKNIEASEDYVQQVCMLIHDRVVLIPDLWSQSHFFFVDPDDYDATVTAKIWKPETSALIADFIPVLEKTEPFTKEALETNIKAFIQAKGIGMGQLMNPFRLAMVGTNAGPGMLDIATIIGRENTIRRVSRGIEKIKN
ncbi:MAG TPA: glutamate--tRNA ligase [Bacteroidales bacterium]|nr:glutamate--tRNA ligase [Bacteroidales bacterium]